jgi:hypothetical protein
VHPDRGGVFGEARPDLEHRNRAGGVEQLEIRKHENADHDAARFSANVPK